jgi:hypothetical protein
MTKFKYLCLFIVILAVVFLINGFCHYREYYESGELKREFHGVEFSDNKTIAL